MSQKQFHPGLLLLGDIWKNNKGSNCSLKVIARFEETLSAELWSEVFLFLQTSEKLIKLLPVQQFSGREGPFQSSRFAC